MILLAPTVAFLEMCSVLWPSTRQSFRCVHLSPLFEGRTHFALLRTALCSAEPLLGIQLCKGNVLLRSARNYRALLCRDVSPRRRRSSCSPACELSLCSPALELVLSSADFSHPWPDEARVLHRRADAARYTLATRTRAFCLTLLELVFSDIRPQSSFTRALPSECKAS